MKLFRKTAPTPVTRPNHRYLVVRVIHPALKAHGGYLKAGYSDYKWTNNWLSATHFGSYDTAHAFVRGFGVHHKYYYKIERL